MANGYTLATPVDDVAITLTSTGTKKWQPANFDKREHGRVPLYEALAQSYNLATIRVGMDVGVEADIQGVHKNGRHGQGGAGQDESRGGKLRCHRLYISAQPRCLL